MVAVRSLIVNGLTVTVPLFNCVQVVVVGTVPPHYMDAVVAI